MTPENVILSVLEPIAGLKGKVYPVEALKNASDPFVFYRQTAGEEDDDLDGLNGLHSATFEIHCVTRSYAALVSLSGAVRQALQGAQGRNYEGLLVERAKVRQASPDLHEREVNLMRRVYSLQLDYQGGPEL